MPNLLSNNPTSNYTVREKESFNHAHEIIKSSGVIEEILAWAKQELSGDWRWQLIEMSSPNKPGRYIFYFDLERDYLAFILKWS